MGNEQSAPTPRRQANKLSKPKTNNNSNLNLLNSKSAPPSRRNSVSTNNDYPTRNRESRQLSQVLETIEKPPRVEPTQKKRLSLFRSRSEKVKTVTLDLDPGIERQFVPPSPVEAPPHRWSRTPVPRGTSQTRVAPTPVDEPQYDSTPELHLLRSRMSFHQAQAAQCAQQLSRLSLVSELPSPYLETTPDIRSISRTNSIQGGEDIAVSVSNSGSRRDSGGGDRYGPIRRRSLLQHGVATRPTPKSNDSRRSLPSQIHPPEFSRDQYASLSSIKSPPQLAPPVFLPNPAYAAPVQRAVTPTEQDYRHIGAYKLGSLRITNGAASPTPSRDGRTSSLGAEDEYGFAKTKHTTSEKEERHGLSQRSKTFSVPAEVKKVPWIVRTESPLHQSDNVENGPLAIHIPDPSFALFDFKPMEHVFNDSLSPTKSLELAHEYQEEIALSPFSFDHSPLPSPRLESTSKHTAIEDDLFAAEPGTPQLEGLPRMHRSFDSGYEGGPVRKSKGSKEKDAKPLAKADSGYSSIISLRSFKKDAPPAVPAKDSAPTTISESISRVPSSTYSVNSSIGPEAIDLRKRPLPMMPVEVPTQPRRQAPPVPPKATSQEFLPPALLQIKSAESIATVAQSQPHLQVPKKNPRGKSLPAVAKVARETREDSPADSDMSGSSTASSMWQRKKLNKRTSRPSSFQPQPEPVYTVQAFRSPSEVLRIPVPSPEIRRQLDERVEGFPVVAFPNTVSGTTKLRRTASKETLGTIFSVGSAEVRDELNFARLQSALPAIPTEATIPEDPIPSPDWVPRPDFNKRHTFQGTSPAHSGADWTPREAFQNLATPNQKSVPKQAEPKIQKAPARYPSPVLKQDRAPTEVIREKTSAAKLVQKVSSQQPSPAPMQRRASRQNLQKPPSREPSPISSFRGSLDADFEARITSFDGVSSSLGRSAYEVATNSFSKQPGLSANERAKSLATNFEANNKSRFVASRSVSQESQASTIIRPMRSYDSITNANPWSGDNRSQPRLSSRGPPPQAHANGRRPYSFQHAISRESLPSYGGQFNYESADEAQRSSAMYQKPKSGPPVSMNTQRNVSQPIPPSHQQAAPARQAPPAPTEVEIADGWKQSAGAWAQRRESAGKLSARSSFETNRPSFDQSQPQHELKSRNSYGGSLRRAGTARPSAEYSRPPMLHGGKSFDTSQQQRQPSWGQANHSTQNQSYGLSEYNHTYGSTDFSNNNKENFMQYMQQQSEPEYYESEQPYDRAHQQTNFLPETFHRRKTSTSEMLVLDRFSGGLDYGYESGLGLTGSAGTRVNGKMGGGGRKSVRESELFGVDFSDVPIMVQRVRV